MKPKASSTDLFELSGRLDDLEISEAAALVRKAGALAEVLEKAPEVVCLIGSTRFHDHFRMVNERLTLKGAIVLSIGCDTKSDAALGLTEADKEELDLLHAWKIVMADRVICLNIEGYIGFSTARELGFARLLGQKIEFAVPMQSVPVNYNFPKKMAEVLALAATAEVKTPEAV